MGLDMYLVGEKYYSTYDEECPVEDGFKLETKDLRLGYWRKHPDLHGYIVNTFADGKDECQKIDLCEADIKQILAAIDANQLPHTEGFFFGASDETDKLESIEILKKALKWLAIPREQGCHKSVYYRASW